MLVERRGDCHIGNLAQVCEVELSVMGHAVLADDAGAVDAESDREVLDCHVVDNLVKAPLQEG